MPHLSPIFANRSIATLAEFMRKRRLSIFRDTPDRFFWGIETGKYGSRMHGDRARRHLVSMDNFRGKKVKSALIDHHIGNKAMPRDSSVSIGATMITPLDAMWKQVRGGGRSGGCGRVAQKWHKCGKN
jgi:hypothetical protein